MISDNSDDGDEEISMVVFLSGFDGGKMSEKEKMMKMCESLSGLWMDKAYTLLIGGSYILFGFFFLKILF